jgi:starch synthase
MCGKKVSDFVAGSNADGLFSQPVTKRRLRIAIATSGRFHVLDLARELAALGHEVRLYSMLPSSRVEVFGLPPRYHRSMLPAVAPIAAWQRFAPNLLPRIRSWALVRALDFAISRQLEPCDFFICMSGIFLNAPRAARRKFNAQVWLERGSRHILSQAEILASIPGASQPFADLIERELVGYREVDRIVVPSRQAAESFDRDLDAKKKLFINPYGVDLNMFSYLPRARAQKDGVFWLVFAGTWSLQKGCDVLENAVRQCDGVRLLHIGSLGDYAFPQHDDRFEHRKPVPQAELAQYYASADALVLASRQDGFGLVLAQALATGLPIICTDRTGGEDLKHTPRLAAGITVVPHDDVTALQRAIESLRDARRAGDPIVELFADDLETLSWAAYAARYEAELINCTQVTGK